MLERLTAWLAGGAAEDLVPRQFGFNTPLPMGVCLALLAAAGLVTAIWYWRRLAPLKTPRRVALVALRTAAVLLLVFLALDPAVIAQHVRPGEQFVALLFDDSLSMRIAESHGQSRGETLKASYAAAREQFEDRLKRRHQVVRYAVGESTEPLRDVEGLQFDRKQSDLAGSVAQVVRDLEGSTVSGVVLFSDGVQLAEDPLDPQIADGVRVYTVGVGDAAAWSDIEITGLRVKRTDFDRSPVVLTVVVRSVGLEGQGAIVEVAIGSRVIRSKTIAITGPAEDHEVVLEFIPDRPDWIEYEARVRIEEPPAAEVARVPADRIAENNARTFAVDNRKKLYRVLYVSGRPNWQNKFFRMALEADAEQLHLTSLIAISNAERKFEFRGRKSTLSNPLFQGFEEEKERPRYDETVFIRMGASKDELTSGYPTLPEDLFGYDVIIFGDVERPFFTSEQLDLTRDFVEKRGGTLLMLGGPRAFTEGGYAGTVIEKMLPLLLYQKGTGPAQLRQEGQFQARPTIEGRLAGSWMFEQDERGDEELWSSLPPIYSLDRFPLVRAGATVMAVGTAAPDEDGGPPPLFAVQRYGEGRCAVLATGDTWQWQMRAEQGDDRHERFWRQIVRNLVKDVPDSVVWRARQDAYTQGDPADLDFLVRDGAFERREGAQCSITVTAPDGTSHDLAVEESLEEAGVYRAPFTPEVAGLYAIELSAADGDGKTIAHLEEALLVQPDHREFRTAQFNPEFLRELAEAHGGRMYSMDELGALAEAIPVPPSLDAKYIELHLWHLPGFYAVLVACMIAEWYLRRRAGQA
jgi:hypothetical protein